MDIVEPTEVVVTTPALDLKKIAIVAVAATAVVAGVVAFKKFRPRVTVETETA